MLCKMAYKVIEVGANLRSWQWITIKIQTLIDDCQLEVLFIGKFDKLIETTVKRIGAFPTYDKTVNPGRFGPFNMLLHHIDIITGISTQKRIIHLGSIPRSSVKPDIVIGKNRYGARRWDRSTC